MNLTIKNQKNLYHIYKGGKHEKNLFFNCVYGFDNVLPLFITRKKEEANVGALI